MTYEWIIDIILILQLWLCLQVKFGLRTKQIGLDMG